MLSTFETIRSLDLDQGSGIIFAKRFPDLDDRQVVIVATFLYHVVSHLWSLDFVFFTLGFMMSYDKTRGQQ